MIEYRWRMERVADRGERDILTQRSEVEGWASICCAHLIHLRGELWRISRCMWRIRTRKSSYGRATGGQGRTSLHFMITRHRMCILEIGICSENDPCRFRLSAKMIRNHNGKSRTGSEATTRRTRSENEEMQRREETDGTNRNNEDTE